MIAPLVRRSRAGVMSWIEALRLADPSLVVVAGGLALLLLPVISDMARYHWSTPGGAQGPLVLVSGIWLVWRECRSFRFAPPAISSHWLLLIVPLVALYLFGRSLRLIGTESVAALSIIILLGCFYFGLLAMRRTWFAWLYLAFLIRPPQSLVVALTGPLQIGLSEISVRLLALAHYRVGNAGVTIQVGQYELLVAEACSGLGSLIALLAIGLLYVHLTRTPTRRHALLLLIGIVPIALVANLVRVMFIIMLTYYAGDAVAQSFAHELAGLATFSLSLTGMAALDRALALPQPAAR
ncbi:MAG: exosortase [Pseudomonadota bacterium]|nr:exosortase [Pseudomonadota bacterium]